MNTLPIQKSGSGLIMGRSTRMVVAIKLNREPDARAIEVQNVAPHRMLPAE
jgi:hypothetical protein